MAAPESAQTKRQETALQLTGVAKALVRGEVQGVYYLVLYEEGVRDDGDPIEAGIHWNGTSIIKMIGALEIEVTRLKLIAMQRAKAIG